MGQPETKQRDRYSFLKKWLPPGVFLFVSFLYTYPLIFPLRNLGIGDWDLFTFYNAVPRRIVLSFYQFPLWNPYYCGGLPMMHNPQDGFLRPTFLLPLIFGAPVGLKLEVLLMYTLGFVGMYLLGRSHDWSIPASGFAALVFVLCSFFSLHISDGHLNHLPYMLFPYVFIFFGQVQYSFGKALLVGFLFFWMILAGGVGHVLIPCVLFLFVYSFFVFILRSNRRLLVILLVGLVVASGLGAVKLIPATSYMLDNPRFTNNTDTMGLSALDDIFLNRVQLRNVEHFGSQHYGWHEYGAYTGIIPLVFFAIGLIVFWRRRLPLLLTGGVFLALSMGSFASLSPWSLLHSLPILKNMRVPSRFIIFVVFVLALMNGQVVNWLIKRVGEFSKPKSRYLRRLLVVLLVVAAVDLFVVSSQPFRWAMRYTPPEIVKSHDQFRQRTFGAFDRVNSQSSMYKNYLENRGTLLCEETMPHKTQALSSGLEGFRGEAFTVQGGSVNYSLWSPNRLILQVTSSDETLVVINQNYHHGWKVRGKPHSVSYDGKLAAWVPADRKKVEFYYRPTEVLIGAAGSVSAFLLLLGFVVVRWKN